MPSDLSGGTEGMFTATPRFRLNLVNQRFGRLVVSKFHSKRQRASYWECLCDCGTTVIVRSGELRRGKSKSCGCYRRDLRIANNTTHGKYHTPEHLLWRAAKMRAKKKGLSFDIESQDIKIPENCPLLGIKLQQSKDRLAPNSPSLDRLDTSRGYVRGNVWVISHAANRMKGDATLDELKLFVKNLERVLYASVQTGETSSSSN